MDCDACVIPLCHVKTICVFQIALCSLYANSTRQFILTVSVTHSVCHRQCRRGHCKQNEHAEVKCKVVAMCREPGSRVICACLRCGDRSVPVCSSMVRKESMAFDAISSTDMSKGFTNAKFSWLVYSLASRFRSREFSIPGCASVKWSLGVEKKGQTTIGLYCKEAPSLITVIFRITIYDGDEELVMNRSCYFTFGGSNGCGFKIENWTILERRLRLQCRPLVAYLVVDVPKDRSFLGKSSSMAASALFPRVVQSHIDTMRSEFRAIESPDQEPPPHSDVTVIVAKKLDEEVHETDEMGRGETIKEQLHCHRHVLCSHSAVFKQMLEKNDFLESSRGIIDVSTDIDRSTMIALLRYMYIGEVGKEYDEFEMELDSVVRLLNAAEKYELAGLKAWCQSSMIVGYDTDEQRRHQLVVADIYDLKQLKAICVAQLSSDPEKLDKKAFQEILQVDGKVFEEIQGHKNRKNDTMCIALK